MCVHLSADWTVQTAHVADPGGPAVGRQRVDREAVEGDPGR